MRHDKKIRMKIIIIMIMTGQVLHMFSNPACYCPILFTRILGQITSLADCDAAILISSHTNGTGGT
jgi:hypothetical protein